jgi:hypothetical protein
MVVPLLAHRSTDDKNHLGDLVPLQPDGVHRGLVGNISAF